MEDISRHIDVAIIGGGVMGSAIAYFLKERIPRDGLSVMVIEKDPTVRNNRLGNHFWGRVDRIFNPQFEHFFQYAKCSTVLSVGGVRQQFSLPENVEMSMYSAEFLRNAHKHLAVESSSGPDMHFQPMGYLFTASENGAEQLLLNQKMQE